MCPCGKCHSLDCCECCAWFDHPADQDEGRSDAVEEQWQRIQALPEAERERLAEEYRERFREHGGTQ